MSVVEEIETCVRIVEDSDILTDMLGLMMELEGIRYCKTTHNFHLLLGPELWEGVTAVLCDLDLGGSTTGEMVLEYLKETHPWIKRVVLSAVADVSTERIRGLSHVALAKPTNQADIAKAVR